MMIISRGYLFAYNVDKAICVRIKGHDVKSAVLIGRRLYGPIFDGNCETQFSSSPKSSTIRNCFYMAIIIMLFVSLIAPCYHFINAFRAGVWSSDLIVAWLFIFLDAFLIINRVFFRASIRRFWARTLGDDNFRAILDFELSNKEDSALLPHSVVTDEKDLCSDRIPGYTNRVPSQKRLILTGVILIMLVVWALNSRRNKPTQTTPNVNNVSTERGQASWRLVVGKSHGAMILGLSDFGNRDLRDKRDIRDRRDESMTSAVRQKSILGSWCHCQIRAGFASVWQPG